jgi:hypothetical protein
MTQAYRDLLEAAVSTDKQQIKMESVPLKLSWQRRRPGKSPLR